MRLAAVLPMIASSSEPPVAFSMTTPLAMVVPPWMPLA